jgi:nucleotidyltransferase/DNA polymerase involved in DNA repair
MLVLTRFGAAGSVSVEAARAKCPGLVVLPMRTARYREVSAQVFEALRKFAPSGLVDKASCDDFYFEVSGSCLSGGPPLQAKSSAAPDRLHLVGADGELAFLDLLLKEHVLGRRASPGACVSPPYSALPP